MRGGGHREPGLRGGEGPGLGPKRGPAGSAACTERSPRGRPASCRAPPAPGGGEEGTGSTGGGPDPLPPSLGTGALGSLGASLWAVPLPGPCC